MFNERKLFFKKEVGVHWTSMPKLVFNKEYAHKQCEVINKDYAHNVYFHPNGEYDNSEEWKVVLYKKPHREYIHTFFNWSIEDHLIKLEQMNIEKPTAIVSNWETSVAYWKLKKILTTDLSDFVSHINTIIQWKPVRVKQESHFLYPWFQDHKTKTSVKILYNNKWKFTEEEPKKLEILDVSLLQKYYQRYIKLQSSYKKAQWIFKNIFNVTLSSLNFEKVLPSIKLDREPIYSNDRSFIYPPLLSENIVMWDYKSVIAMANNNDKTEVDIFLHEQYGISIFWKNLANEKITYNEIDLVFSDVWLSIWKENKKWEVTYKRTIMWSIKVLWYAMTDKHYKWWSLPKEQKVFIVLHEWEQKILYPETRVATFNAWHMSQWVAFTWNDSDLLTMFQVLSQTVTSEYMLVSQSWNNEYYYALWDYVHIKSEWFPVIKSLGLPTYKDDDLHKISIEGFYEKMSKIWNPEKTSIIVLWAIALCGLDFWKNAWFRIMPFIFINGTTWSGKSEIMQTMLPFCWYKHNARKYMANWVTRQVLSTEATEPAILFLDEFTQIKDPQIENIIRNIANWGKAWRWYISWNVYYDFNSPLFVTGEDIPASDSVINRTIFLDLSIEDRQDNEKTMAIWMIEQLQSMTAFDSILDFYTSTDPVEIKNIYKEKKKVLLNNKFNSREADVRSYVLTMNEFFTIIKEADLIENINKNLYYVRKEDWAQTPFEALQDIVMQWVLNRMVRATIINDEVNSQKTLQIFMLKEYYQSHQTQLKKYADRCLKEWYDVILGPNRLYISYSSEPEWFDSTEFDWDMSEQSKVVSSFIEWLWWHLHIKEIDE